MKKFKIFVKKIKIFIDKIINHQETAQITASGFPNPQWKNRPIADCGFYLPASMPRNRPVLQGKKKSPIQQGSMQKETSPRSALPQEPFTRRAPLHTQKGALRIFASL